MQLVIGASGLVGGCLLRNLQDREIESVGTYYGTYKDGCLHLDIVHKKYTESFIKAIKPSVIYLASSFTNVDLCEVDACSYLVNVEGVKNVVDAISKVNKNTRLVFFSSDYVFDGRNTKLDSEDSLCNPVNKYGVQKLIAENYIAHHCNNYTIVRTSGVFGESDNKNFAIRAINNWLNKRSIAVPQDQYGTPTYAPDLASCVIGLGMKRPKLVHLVNEGGTLSRVDFAEKLYNLASKHFVLPPISKCIIIKNTEDLHQKAKRPKFGGLKSNEVKIRALYKALPDFMSGVKKNIERG